VTHSSLKKLSYQQIIKINLIENPNSEAYLWHYDWLYDQRIDRPFPRGLDEEAYRQLLKKSIPF
jgi:hypothetical protein